MIYWIVFVIGYLLGIGTVFVAGWLASDYGEED